MFNAATTDHGDRVAAVTAGIPEDAVKRSLR
jgi:hypothetical protein